MATRTTTATAIQVQAVKAVPAALPDTIKADESDLSDPPPTEEIQAPATKKRRVAPRKNIALATVPASDSLTTTPSDIPPPPQPEEKTKRARKPRATKAEATTTVVAAATEDAAGQVEAANEEASPKKKRARKPKPPIVYDIPEVPRKETTFKGRLGYACLNTILRNIKPATDTIFASRTCRIDTIEKNGMDFVRDLGLKNVRDLYKMVEWNEENNIRFMRMSSEMFPFASHEKYGYSLEYAEADLKAVGDLAKRLGHRLTLHPGQFTQIASPTKKVVDSSVRELEYHCEMMERMGLAPDGVMIIHMGGVYNDKEATLARFRTNYTTLLSEGIKRRLVLENDEICYNLDDLMPICDELDIPIVVDYHHDWINPSSRPLRELIPIINQTWARKGIKPKQHLSEPRPGAVTAMEKRAHADRCGSLPEELQLDDNIHMDLMIEAKDKEQAVFELYRIYGLAEVKHENLRPPNPDATLATAGRKAKSSASSPKK
ncbi:UV-endonuclease UvdE [Clavulina sp. PMI_390]|nr:UV-endonuclease UvdE [Clavulina sp. PMI_390]